VEVLVMRVSLAVILPVSEERKIVRALGQSLIIFGYSAEQTSPDAGEGDWRHSGYELARVLREDVRLSDWPDRALCG
jgi:hypothetical protein